MVAERVITSKDNFPPSDAVILSDRLNDTYKGELSEIERLSLREIPDEITDEKIAGEFTDYVNAIDTALKGIDGIHKKEKAPFWESCGIVDLFKNTQIKKLSPLKEKTLKVLDAHIERKEEAERKRLFELAKADRERAEALAAEAEAHAKEGIHDTAEDLMDKAFQKDEEAVALQNYALSAPSSALAKIRSAGGSSATRKTFWVAEYITTAGLDLNEVKDFFKLDEIQAAYDRHVKQYADSKELKGVKIYQKTELKGVR